MSLLDKASLVLTPNAYKASKLYSVIPNTTLGDMTVVRATTATRVNSAGLIESVAVNVPRIDYTNGSCPSLLVEPQRTNLFTYSEQLDNPAWILDGDGVGQSVTANYSTSPDGTQNADRLQLNKTGGTYSRIRQNKSGAGTYAFTVYMKSNTSNTQNVGLRLDSTGINCVVTPTWQRFTLNATVGTPVVQILLFDSIVGNDETADISVWGAQLEVGSYASSYIPTVASTVTRNADVITVAPPVGTVKITTTFQDNSTTVLTTIPATYTMPEGRINNVLMQHTL